MRRKRRRDTRVRVRRVEPAAMSTTSVTLVPLRSVYGPVGKLTRERAGMSAPVRQDYPGKDEDEQPV